MIHLSNCLLRSPGVVDATCSYPRKKVYRVEAKFLVNALFNVVAETKEEAKELAASSPTVLHAKAVGYGLDYGQFDVDENYVWVEDLGEASDADVARSEKVIAIRP